MTDTTSGLKTAPNNHMKFVKLPTISDGEERCCQHSSYLHRRRDKSTLVHAEVLEDLAFL